MIPEPERDLEPNVPLLRKVLEHIEQHEDEWEQMVYATYPRECGMAYCFAGWALVMTGHTLERHSNSSDLEYVLDGEKVSGWGVSDAAASELGLREPDARRLFSGDNSLRVLRWLVENYAGEAL